MLLLAVGYGASAIAGQDEDGTLALLAVLPLRRGSLLVQKAGTLALQALLLAAAVGIFAVAGRAFQLTIAVSHIVEVAALTFLFGLDFGLVALTLGAITGRKGFAIGVTTAVAAVSYLLSSLAPVVDWIRPGRFFSLLYWSIGNDQLANGATFADFVVLIAVGVCLLAAANAAFKRLDLH